MSHPEVPDDPSPEPIICSFADALAAKQGKPKPQPPAASPDDGHPYNATAVDYLNVLLHDLEALRPVIGSRATKLNIIDHQNLMATMGQLELCLAQLQQILQRVLQARDQGGAPGVLAEA